MCTYTGNQTAALCACLNPFLAIVLWAQQELALTAATTPGEVSPFLPTKASCLSVWLPGCMADNVEVMLPDQSVVKHFTQWAAKGAGCPARQLMAAQRCFSVILMSPTTAATASPAD